MVQGKNLEAIARARHGEGNRNHGGTAVDITRSGAEGMKELGGNARGKWSHLEPVRMKPMRAPREIDLGIVLPGTSATAARAHGGMLKRVDAGETVERALLARQLHQQ